LISLRMMELLVGRSSVPQAFAPSFHLDYSRKVGCGPRSALLRAESLLQYSAKTLK
jgi:hypothetical protein